MSKKLKRRATAEDIRLERWLSLINDSHFACLDMKHDIQAWLGSFEIDNFSFPPETPLSKAFAKKLANNLIAEYGDINLRQLSEYTSGEILRIPNVSEKSLAEVEFAIRRAGFLLYDSCT
ncbi:MAG: hypothetical protein ACPGSN_10120 [Psychrobium sp.]